jgi:hypothetical protein
VKQRFRSTKPAACGILPGMEPGDIEAVGDAVTGGMVARAVEPGAGEGEAGREGACLNCGAGLVGPYCHRCGQVGHVHRTVAAWWHDLAHGVLHLDGKIWRTLPLLALHPGELTRRYIDGERARFVSPLALFLFSVFLMFAIFSAFGGGVAADPTGVQRGLAEEIRVEQAAIAKLEGDRAAAAAAGKATADLDRRLKAARDELSLVKTMKERGFVQGATVRVSDDLPHWLREPMEKAGKNPSLFLYKIQTNAYKFSWTLIPISLPFLWMLFLHRGRYRETYKAYDHLVFVTYSIAFMSLALIAVVMLRTIHVPSALLGLATLIVPPVHMYRQLRGAYALSRLGALWRTVVLVGMTGVAMTLFLLVLVALGVLG